MSKLMELVEEYGNRLIGAFVRDSQSPADAVEAKRLLSEIRAAVQELERDAVRYRWLRHAPDDWQLAICTDLDVIDHGSSGVIGTFDEILTGDDADKAIDAAMEAANGN